QPHRFWSLIQVSRSWVPLPFVNGRRANNHRGAQNAQFRYVQGVEARELPTHHPARGGALAMDPSVNRDTFEKGLVALYPRLFPLALRLCRDRADAHDLVQDAVERGLRCRALFRGGDTPDRWMSTI